MGWLTFWNPKNLQKKVDMYGYHFSWKTHAVMIFLALAGVIGIGAVFRLKAGGVVIALTAVIMMLPVLVLDMYHKMYEQKRFADEYLIDCNGTRAYKAAYPSCKKDSSADANARKLLGNARIREYIDEKLDEMHSAKTADAQEVIEYLTAVMRGV